MKDDQPLDRWLQRRARSDPIAYFISGDYDEILTQTTSTYTQKEVDVHLHPAYHAEVPELVVVWYESERKQPADVWHEPPPPVTTYPESQ